MILDHVIAARVRIDEVWPSLTLDQKLILTCVSAELNWISALAAPMPKVKKKDARDAKERAANDDTLTP